jgi:hypothetical protein
MHLAAGRSKKTARITSFWLKIAHIDEVENPNFGHRGSLRREITRENGIRREIPEEKTGPPGDFACRREIPGDRFFGPCRREISRWPPGGGNAA